MKKTSGTMVAIIVVAILIGTFITAKYATAGESAKDGRFIAYGNGTVLDTQTNLMWAAKDIGRDINWENARSYCRNYSGGGYKDWRMPTQNELAGLYDQDKTYNTVCGDNVHLTELIRLTCRLVWASRTRGDTAAVFNFSDGHRFWNRQSGVRKYRVLPVRSGK